MFLINQLHTNIETINYTKTLTHVLTVCTNSASGDGFQTAG